MNIYRVQSREDWERLKLILAGQAFFKFDPIQGYLIKMSSILAQKLEKSNIKLILQ